MTRIAQLDYVALLTHTEELDYVINMTRTKVMGYVPEMASVLTSRRGWDFIVCDLRGPDVDLDRH